MRSHGSAALLARLLEGTTVKRSGRLVAGPVFSFAADAEEAGVGQCALLVVLAEAAEQDALPEGVVLSAVTRLDLSALNLTVLPEQLCAFAGLKDLDVSFNRLTVLPDTLSQLPALQRLDVSGNPLTALPAGLEDVVVGWRR